MIIKRFSLLTSLIVLMGGLFSFSASAIEYSTGWLQNPDHPPVELRYMLTGQQNLESKTVEALLEVKLDTDWKTYWRSPGEGGVAPSIDWSLSNNLEGVDWHWPMPKRYEFLGVETLGYKHTIIFPMTIHVSDMSKPVFLSGVLTMSSCTNICVLTDYEITLDFNPTDLTASEQAMHLYNQGMSNVPKEQPSVEITALSWDKNSKLMSVVATNTLGWHQPDVFIDGESQNVQDASFLKPTVQVDGNTLTAQMKVSSWFGEPKLLGETLNVTISDTDFSVETQGIANDIPVTLTTSSSNLLEIIGIALLGGLILNIMPCVLPVLGMKLSSVIAAEGLEKRQIRMQFLSSAAGILTSFWLLAGFMIVLKLSGQALGWGVQFQSPYFIGAMVVITALFAANMLGLFEIRLSSGTNTWLATKGDDSYVGHFVQGMFSTLLATPCSAPFLGTAVAFALGADVVTLVAIFTALAIGMATPWLVIALFPRLAHLLPKPGMWMDKLKTLFGLMMLATSLWLLSLMTSFFATAAVVLVGVLLIIVLLWRLGKVKGRKPVILAMAFIIVGSGGGLIAGSMTADNWATPLPQNHAWQPLNIDAIQQQVSQGKIIFVDVTADWCITCKVNKVSVLLQDPIYSALEQDHIVLMKGDWTKPSDYVTGFLRSNGRFGVPFNIVYGPKAPMGIALPVILTNNDVINALEAASGKGAE
ncbi:thioredoxin family protein [Photobacterium sp. ZSDE20]|uniref:Thioredoxin family protein n=1 Tax=Photobacterium pectinilyticum TaxID=2906793 RepID=A0ABT1N6J9_9GAMM|nr:protein-disulfide reductase DsbD domain-containing protein [Photobacterium sp. ZSDE20]MCQ1060366.1 thioredoxin family protein [Photobacterium sp. ZSDE20]MDD1826898.1 thioredoxin family protein [Photobacterium sp. ZSDE20]